MNKLEYRAEVIIQNEAQQENVMDNMRQRLKKNMKDRKRDLFLCSTVLSKKSIEGMG